MKFKSILTAALFPLLFAACTVTPKTGGENSEKQDAPAETNLRADSLIYSLGQIRGAEYLKEASRDSLLNTKAAREEYLRGVKAGLDAVKSGKDAYNKGLLQGVQMAGNIQQFYDDYNVRLSNKMFVKGMSDVVLSDSSFNTSETQSRFYRLISQFNREKEQRDKESALFALKAAGEALGMKEISEQLWGLTPDANAPLIKDGDKIKIELSMTTLSGKSIDTPFPKDLTVGQRLSNNPVSEAITCLSSGQTGTFITSAQALLGARAHQLGLKPADVIKITVTPTLTPKEKAQ